MADLNLVILGLKMHCKSQIKSWFVREGKEGSLVLCTHIHLAVQTCHELLYSMKDKYSMTDIKLLKPEISN